MLLYLTTERMFYSPPIPPSKKKQKQKQQQYAPQGTETGKDKVALSLHLK